MIHVLIAGNFSCERIAARLMHGDANRRPLMAPLLQAATLGNLSAVKNLLASGVDANIRYGDDEASALDMAVLMGHLEVVSALLEHGVDVNSVGSFDETALHAAVLLDRAHVDLVDLLLSAGADIDARSIQGMTALHFAAKQPNMRCNNVETMLLQRGAAKDALDAHGRSPLHYAACHGNLAATRALLAAGADATFRVVDNGALSPLDVAASFGQIEVIKELVQHGVDPDAAPNDDCGYTALHQAAFKNHPRAVDALLEAGASVARQNFGNGKTPLHLAVERLSLDALHALLQHGAPVRALQGGEVDRRCDPPIHLATEQGGRQGAAEVVDLLLRWGADEFELDDDGNTAAEVVGADVLEEQSLARDANRVSDLLANAPADRTWRRRGLLLLCLARDPRSRRRRRGGSGGEENGAEEQGVEHRAEEGALAKDGDGGAGDGGSDGVGAVPWRDVVASLLEFEEQGFFRTIVKFL
ncbi:unnamed protein product [Laminaria digitata]